MTKEEIKKELSTKVGYKVMILNNIRCAVKKNLKGFKIRVVEECGRFSRKHYSVDHTSQYTQYLDKLKIKYSIGNDAKRGGMLGKYILIKIDKRNSVIKAIIEDV